MEIRTRTLIAILALACGSTTARPFAVSAGGVTLDATAIAVGEQLAPAIRERRMTIAVLDLPTLDGQSSVLGRYLAEDLVTTLFGLGVRVVERRLLDRAMGELELGLGELMNPDAAMRFGRLVGAEGLLIGTLTDLGTEVKLNVRVVQVETGHVVSAAAAVLAKNDEVSSMLSQRLARPRPGGPQPRPPQQH